MASLTRDKGRCCLVRIGVHHEPVDSRWAAALSAAMAFVAALLALSFQMVLQVELAAFEHGTPVEILTRGPVGRGERRGHPVQGAVPARCRGSGDSLCCRWLGDDRWRRSSHTPAACVPSLISASLSTSATQTGVGSRLHWQALAGWHGGGCRALIGRSRGTGQARPLLLRTLLALRALGWPVGSAPSPAAAAMQKAALFLMTRLPCGATGSLRTAVTAGHLRQSLPRACRRLALVRLLFGSAVALCHGFTISGQGSAPSRTSPLNLILGGSRWLSAFEPIIGPEC